MTSFKTKWRRAWELRGGMLVLLAMLLTGCGESTPGLPVQPAEGDSPRERFEWIMQRFKRHFTGFDTVVPTRDGASNRPRRLLLRFVVEGISYEIHGCDQPAGACTAQMTVCTTTHYSLLAPDPVQERQEESENEADKPSAGLRTRRDDVTAESPTQTERLSPSTVAALLQPKSKRDTDTYDFSWQKGRWVLTTEDVDLAIKGAIEFALSAQ